MSLTEDEIANQIVREIENLYPLYEQIWMAKSKTEAEQILRRAIHIKIDEMDGVQKYDSEKLIDISYALLLKWNITYRKFLPSRNKSENAIEFSISSIKLPSFDEETKKVEPDLDSYLIQLCSVVSRSRYEPVSTKVVFKWLNDAFDENLPAIQPEWSEINSEDMLLIEDTYETWKKVVWGLISSFKKYNSREREIWSERGPDGFSWYNSTTLGFLECGLRGMQDHKIFELNNWIEFIMFLNLGREYE